MNKIINKLAGIFGFWFGAGGFWQKLLFSDRLERDENIAAKQYRMLLIFRPVIVSVSLWLFLVVCSQLPQAFTNFLADTGLDQKHIVIESMKVMEWVEQAGSCLVSFYDKVDDRLNTAFSPVASVFPYNPFFKFSAIGIYIFCYNLMKKKTARWLIAKGEYVMQTIPEIRDMIAEIYIMVPGSEAYRLSPKWERIKTNLGAVITLNFLIIYFLNLRTHFATNTMWEFLPSHLIPITGFFGLMEAYHYLCFADTVKNRSKQDAMFDLVKLRVDYQQYAQERGVSMICEYRRNHALTGTAGQMAVDCLIEPDDSVHAFLYEYLEERYQLNHIDMAKRLVEGENIFYASPFYKDIDACIFFPMFQTLLRQKKGLVLVEDDGELEEVAQWLRGGIATVHGLKMLWNVAVLKDTVRDVDLGILPFQRISSGHDVEGLDEFLEEVAFAVVLKASDMLVGGQETIAALAERIHGGFPKCTWLLCDWNAESMVDLFSHLLGINFTYVSATPVGAVETMVSYWDVETEPNRVWNPAKRFLGLEVGIAEVAGRNQLSHTVWYGEEWMPVIDMNWIIGQYYQLYSRRTAQPVSQSRMNTQIKCSISGISNVIEKEGFLVVEDSFCNLYEAARQYTTRARDKVYVHVLSPNYLLRDFMKAQSDTMNYDPKYIAQFVPEYVNSIRNIYLHLLRRLLEGEVSKKEIYESLRDCEDGLEFGRESYGSFYVKTVIEDIIKILLNIPFKAGSDIQTMVRRTFSEDEECMVREHSYHIINKGVRRAFHKYFQQACYIDETGKKCYINHLMLAGHLELKYLPGQYVTLNGKYYQVERIISSGQETLLGVKRASEQMVERCYYRQLRKYEQKQTRNPKLVFREDGISLTRLTMDFMARTVGYLTIRKNWNNLKNAQKKEYICSGREYFQKHVLCVNVPLGKIGRNGLFHLAAVIHDMFYTFYPQYCYLLSVAVCWQEHEEAECRRYAGVLSKFTVYDGQNAGKEAEDARDCFYIFEDSREDIGLLQSIERHFGRILQVAAEYIKWSDGRPSYFPE